MRPVLTWSPDASDVVSHSDRAGTYVIWVIDDVPDTAVEEMSWGETKALFR